MSLKLQPLFIVDQGWPYSIVLPDTYATLISDPLTVLAVLYIYMNRSRYQNIEEGFIDFCSEISTDENAKEDCAKHLLKNYHYTRLYEIGFYGGRYAREFNINVDINELIERISSYNKMYHLFKELKDRKKLPQRPVVSTIIPTYKCHARCKYCYAPTNELYYSKRKHSPELTLEEWEKIIDELKKLGIVHVIITGGEPLLRDNIKDIATYIYEKGIWVEVSTKFPFKDKILGLAGKLDKIQISIDTIDNRVQEELIGINNYVDTMLDIIDTLAKKEKTRIQTNAVVTRQTADLLPEYVDTLIQIGVDSILFAPYFNSFVKTVGELIPSCEQLIKAKDTIVELIEKNYDYKLLDNHGTYIVNDKTLVYIGLLSGAIRYFCKDVKEKFEVTYRCGASWNGFVIDPYGYVYGCDRMTWFPDLSIGCAKIETLEDIWPRSRRFLLSREKFSQYECFTCPYFDECIGKHYCYVQAKIRTGKIFAKPFWRCKAK